MSWDHRNETSRVACPGIICPGIISETSRVACPGIISGIISLLGSCRSGLSSAAAARRTRSDRSHAMRYCRPRSCLRRARDDTKVRAPRFHQECAPNIIFRPPARFEDVVYRTLILWLSSLCTKKVKSPGQNCRRGRRTYGRRIWQVY
jgi:hypothetical protein